MAFYDEFERLCNEKGVTPTQVARDNGLTQQTVSHWKTRGSTPMAGTLQKLADYFGVSIAYLLGAEEDRIKMPALDVGDTYFNGAVEVVRSDVDQNKVTIVFQIDDTKMTVGEIRALLDILEKATKSSGISVEGLALLADAASKAVMRPQEAPESPPAPQEGTDTTPPADTPETASEVE